MKKYRINGWKLASRVMFLVALVVAIVADIQVSTLGGI